MIPNFLIFNFHFRFFQGLSERAGQPRPLAPHGEPCRDNERELAQPDGPVVGRHQPAGDFRPVERARIFLPAAIAVGRDQRRALVGSHQRPGHGAQRVCSACFEVLKNAQSFCQSLTIKVFLPISNMDR